MSELTKPRKLIVVGLCAFAGSALFGCGSKNSASSDSTQTQTTELILSPQADPSFQVKACRLEPKTTFQPVSQQMIEALQLPSDEIKGTTFAAVDCKAGVSVADLTEGDLIMADIQLPDGKSKACQIFAIDKNQYGEAPNVGNSNMLETSYRHVTALCIKRSFGSVSALPASPS